MNLLKTLLTVSSFTFFSRVTGLIREVLIARLFGVSAFTDAFNVAFRIPNLLRRLFAEGAFTQAFVPILGEFKATKGDQETKTLLDSITTVLAWSLMVVSFLGALGAPLIVMVVASGFHDADTSVYSAAVWMTRLMFPYIFFIALVAMASAVLNTWKNFAIPAVTPVLLNLAMILAAWLLSSYLTLPIYSLAYGVMLGGFAQLLLQVLALKKMNILPKVSLDFFTAWRFEGVQRVFRKMLTATFAVSIGQISLIINTNYASHLVAGSVSWLSYADRLMEFPTALLGVAVGTILLPNLSQAHADNQHNDYSELLDWGLKLTLLLSMPAVVSLFVFSVPLTATLFHYGRFSAFDVSMTSQALTAYGVGLIGIILVKILAPGFYAKQDIRTPVKIAIVVLVVTQLINLLTVPWLGHIGLALSIGLGACINALMLLIGLLKRKIYRPTVTWLYFSCKLVVASVAMASILFYSEQAFDWIALRHTPWMRVLILGGCLSLGMAAYVLTLGSLGVRWKDFYKKTI